MKNITLFKFLGFSSSDNCVVSRRENGFKLDFSKVTSVEECCSETKKKPKGVMGILVLLMLFLFSNISTAQITLDGDPNDWGTLLSTPGGIKARITDPIDGTDDIWTLGSKDVQQISQWAWTTNSSNDKNNMANVGYYFDGTFLYFFADRRANNGDSAIGFWILQDSVGKLGVTSGGFSGQHIDGDILMISHFVNGGAVADINAYRWTNGALDPTPIPLPTSGLDARVNVNTVNSPPSWNYVPKFGAAGTYPPSSFFEGYIDLSSVNFNLSVCLGTFLAETRNSQSLTASLEDLARGRFGSVPAPKTLVGSSFCSSSPNSGTITLANSETQVSYQLKKDSDDTNVQVAQLGTGGTLTWSNLPAGNYYVVATNTISECTTLIGRPTAVTVVQSPTVSVNSPSKCSNDPAVSITATVNPAGTYTYVWTVPQGASNPGNVASFNATVGGSYSVVVTNGSTNCSGSGSGTLTVNPSPNLVTNNPAPVCAPLTVDLTLPAVTTGSNLQGGTLTYWTNSGATTPLNNPSAVSASGTYYIKVTTSANCTDIKPVTVTIIPVIPIVINCPQNSSTSACAYADQAAVNAAFATWLGGFTASGGNGTLVTSGLQNLSAPNLCAGGNVTVNFSASDDCGKQATCSATFTITAAPQVTVNAPAASSTSACAYADQAAVNAAFATWLGGFTVSGGCNPQGSYGEVSAPNACGGTTTVTYTVMDKCYQTSTVTRAFTITPAPQVTVNAPAASSTSACAYADQAAVNAAFATWLGGFTVSGGCNPQGSYGEVSAPNACGGTTTVTYTVMDKCYQTSTVTRAFTITPAPQVTVNAPAASSTSACAYADQAAVNAAFATWLGGFTVSGGCNPQGSYGEVSAPNACGGTTTVTYTVMDKCYQTSTVTRAFTITPAPQVTVNAPAASSTSACAYADQAAVNAAFATWLGGFTVSGGCNPQGSYGEVSAPNACGGTTTVTYTVMDKCYQTSTVTRAFTITPAPQVTVNAPAASSTSACAYADQAAVNAAFATWLGGFTVSGGCNPQGSYGEVSAPNACGGTTTVTYTVMDKCYQTSTVTRAFTITPAPQVTVNAPAASSTSACAYADQAAVNAAFATWLGGFTVSGGCNPQGSYGEVSAPNACGGTTTVTYTVMDKCYQTSTVTRAFTITPAPQVTVNAPAASSTSACAYADQAAVNAAFATWLGGFTVSGGCNPQGSYGEVSAPNACGGTTTVTYTVMDKCYQTSTVTRAFTITPAPQVTVNAPAASSTSACAYADQAAVNAAFATWLGGFTVSGGCNPQGSYGEVSAPNACGGTTTVTYTVMDKCYQTSTVTRAFTITPAPQVTVNAPAASSTSACAYADQAAVNAAFATWLGGFTVSGGCNPQGSYGEVSAPNACGGTTTVTYTVMDKCYQTSTVTRAFTITPAPQVTVNAPAASSTSACAYADQAAVNAAFATWLGGFTVSGGCNPQGSYGEVSAPNACGGTTTVTYTVMDKCYQTSTVTRAFTITPAPQVTVNAPAASSTSACAYADQAAVNAAFATWLGGFTVSGGCNPQGSYGEVSAPNACGGTTTVTYTVMDKCYQTSTVTRAFTITPAPQVTVNAPAASSTSACAYADQAAVNAAFATWLGGFTVSGGCNPQGSYGEVSAPNACGGTTTVTYTVMDKCYQTSTVTRAFTITPAPQVTVNAPAASSTSACAYADQAAVNAAFATWLGGFTVSGGCNPQGSYGEVSAPNACGGTTTVTYTVMDKCYQTSTVTRAFTITPAPQVTVNAPAASSTSACAYADQAAVNAAFATWLGGFTVSGGCNPQGSYGEVSAPNACGGTTTVTYTVMDKCYQTSTVTRAFTITPAPQVTVNAPAASSTSACAYADQAAVNAAFATWLGGFTVSGGCNPQGSYGEVSAPNACGGTTTVTYTVMDKCYQTSTVTRAFTITPAPQVTVNAPAASSTSACAYADQAAVNAAFATWLGGFTVSGGCNPQGSYGEVSAPNACGGTTTVTYTVMDKCYQTSTVTRAFTITPAPQVTVNAPAASSTSACAYADQAAVNAAFRG
ncbi:hypothetical protein [Flavobacterium capsici]|uniref:HYR domain-containing protein n=1 Tax=Flavobacterium capsici TaxID=3075618 RepID=A0AA96F0J7_9FLAO|nr:hypothetical protein [Flavobacterium sp. PMTSA4]WNM21948.1 hypothetical protein RN605_01000 [Flavobacterium sp. PMTSA4]